MKISKERLEQLIQEEIAVGFVQPEEMNDGERPRDPDGYEGRMVKQNLWKIAEYAKEMYNLLDDSDNLEPWVEEKIAVASFMMDSVGHYLQYELNTDNADAAMSHDSIETDHEEHEHEEGDEEEYEFEFEPEEGEEEEEL